MINILKESERNHTMADDDIHDQTMTVTSPFGRADFRIHAGLLISALPDFRDLELFMMKTDVRITFDIDATGRLQGFFEGPFDGISKLVKRIQNRLHTMHEKEQDESVADNIEDEDRKSYRPETKNSELEKKSSLSGNSKGSTSNAGIGMSHVDNSFDVDKYVWKYLQSFHGKEFIEICEIGTAKVVLHYDKVHNGNLKVEVLSKNDTFSETILDRLISLYQDIYKRGICRRTEKQNVSNSMIEDLERKSEEKKVFFSVQADSSSQETSLFFMGPKADVDFLIEHLKGETSNAKSTSETGGDSSRPPLKFTTSNGIKVCVDQGDLVDQTIDAIVNPANVRLQHGGGAAHAIQKAAGKALKMESEDYISTHGKLRIAEVIHTTSGNLRDTIKHVVHVAGPDSREVNDDEKCKQLLQETFYNCLVYSNDKLEIQSIAIPAISSGIFGVPMNTVTMCAWEALCQFELYISSKMDKDRHLRYIKFINNDRKTVTAMRDTFSRELKKNPQFSFGDGEPETNKGNRRARQLKRDTSNEPGDADFAAHGARAIEPAKSPARKPSSSEEMMDTTESAEQDAKNKEEKEECAICRDAIDDPKELPCKHKFCTPCIDQWFKQQQRCPNCSAVFGVLRGDQPTGGTMNDHFHRWSLPGFSGCGTIEIKYNVPDGVQQANHPNPGSRYKGARRTAYLPANTEGREVLKLLKKAFESGLTFTIGRSTTSGVDNVVTWNDIHHKTNPSAGPYAYPDDTYLKRVKDELAAKGIVP